MGRLQEALQALAERLTEAGLPATAGVEGLTVPGAILAPERLEYNRLGRFLEATIEVVALAPANSYELDYLEQASASIRAAFGIDQFEIGTFTLPSLSPDPLPCVTGKITIEITGA